jgi:toxin CcdB
VITQFDVFENRAPDARRAYPLLVVLQSDLVDLPDSRVVAPMAPRNATAYRTHRLHPLVMIGDTAYVVVVSRLFPIPIRGVGAPVANVRHARVELIAALDILFVGV